MNEWDKRNDYYSKTFVLFEIVKGMHGREVCFLPSKVNLGGDRKATPVRCIKAHSLDYLYKNFKAFAFYDKPYNIYSSVAGFENMPMFSYSPKIRKEQQNEFFNNSFTSYWTSYDFVLDIDNNSLKEAYKDTKSIKLIFDVLKIPYSLRFSGMHGFHFVVRDPLFFSKPLLLIDKVKLCETIASNIKSIEDIQSIDLSIYQPQRVLKVPYSLGGGLNVCLPLSDSQFDSFEVENMHVEEVLKNINLKGRGLLEREFNNSKTSNSCEALINMYGVEL